MAEFYPAVPDLKGRALGLVETDIEPLPAEPQMASFT